MKKCKSCLINYNGNLKRCPLCQGELYGKPSKNVFPKIDNKEKGIIFKILIFISLTIGIICGFIEYMLSGNFKITSYILVGLLSNYIIIKFYILNYRKVLKMINIYFFVIFVLLALWYLVIPSLIITSYIIPILCITIIIFNSVIMLVLRKSYILKYVNTILLDCIIGLVPLILVYFNLSTLPILSYICALLSAIVFMALLIFCYDNVIDEIKKIFNY